MKYPSTQSDDFLVPDFDEKQKTNTPKHKVPPYLPWSEQQAARKCLQNYTTPKAFGSVN